MNNACPYIAISIKIATDKISKERLGNLGQFHPETFVYRKSQIHEILIYFPTPDLETIECGMMGLLFRPFRDHMIRTEHFLNRKKEIFITYLNIEKVSTSFTFYQISIRGEETQHIRHLGRPCLEKIFVYIPLHRHGQSIPKNTALPRPYFIFSLGSLSDLPLQPLHQHHVRLVHLAEWHAGDEHYLVAFLGELFLDEKRLDMGNSIVECLEAVNHDRVAAEKQV